MPPADSGRMLRWVAGHRALLSSLFAVFLSLAAGFIAIALSRADIGVAKDAYFQMIWGGIGDLRALGESGSKGALLLLTGLSVSAALWVGFFNIGAQGQMMLGAIAAAAIGSRLPFPSSIHPLICLLGAALAGALYALIPAVLRLRRRVHEVISTIMLNWVAVSLVENWLVVGPLRAASTSGVSRSGTDEILQTAHLARLLGDASRLNLGLPLAVVAAGAVWFWMARTVHGFETRAVGLGFEAARTAGIAVRRRSYQAMFLSGALAGIAGAVWVLGTEFKYPVSLSSPYGFDGIAIALIGQNHPLGIAAAALFFGILRAGGTGMQLLGIHKSFPELIQGFALLLIAGRLIWETAVSRLARRASTSHGTP